MSVVKLSNGSSSAAMGVYLAGKSEQEERYLSFSSLPAADHFELEESFKLTRELHSKNSGLQYHHASLSLDPGDPKSHGITDQKLTSMAKEFVEKFAPDHDFGIFIHRDTEHPHAHIIWNSVNHENGRKFHSSKKDLYRAIEIKDQLDKKYGLELTKGFGEKKAPQLDLVKDSELRMHERDPKTYSWKEDLKTRIEASLDHSSSWKNFKESMENLGVEVFERGRKDPKLSYKFTDENDKQRRVRETSLGQNYSRKTIEKQIESELFKTQTQSGINWQSGGDAKDRTEKLQPGSGYGISGSGEGIGSQKEHKRKTRRHTQQDQNQDERRHPDLEQVSSEILERAEREAGRGNQRGTERSFEDIGNPENPGTQVQVASGRERRRERGLEEKSQTRLPAEIHDLADAACRFAPSLDPGRGGRVVSPSAIHELDTWRTDHAERTRERGRNLFQGHGRPEPNEQRGVDRNDYESHERILREALRFGVSAWERFGRFRDFVFEKTERAGKLIAEKISKFRDRFKRAESHAEAIRPKIEHGYQLTRKKLQRIELDLPRDHPRYNELQQSKIPEKSREQDKSQGFEMGFRTTPP